MLEREELRLAGHSESNVSKQSDLQGGFSRRHMLPAARPYHILSALAGSLQKCRRTKWEPHQTLFC